MKQMTPIEREKAVEHAKALHKILTDHGRDGDEFTALYEPLDNLIEVVLKQEKRCVG